MSKQDEIKIQSRERKIRDLVQIKALYQLLQQLQNQDGTKVPFAQLKKIGVLCHTISWCEDDAHAIRNKHGYRNRSQKGANKRNDPNHSACLDFESLAQLRNLDAEHQAFAVWPQSTKNIDYANVLNQLLYIWQQEAAVLSEAERRQLPAPSAAGSKHSFALASFAAYMHDFTCLERIHELVQKLSKARYRQLDLNDKVNRYEMAYLFLMLGEASKEVSDLLRPEHNSKNAELNPLRFLFGKLSDYRDKIKISPRVVYGDPAHLTLMYRCLSEAAPHLLSLLAELQKILQQSLDAKTITPKLLSGEAIAAIEKANRKMLDEISLTLSMGIRAFEKIVCLEGLIEKQKEDLKSLNRRQEELEVQLSEARKEESANSSSENSTQQLEISKKVKALLGLRDSLRKKPDPKKEATYQKLRDQYFNSLKNKADIPDPITDAFMEETLDRYRNTTLTGLNPTNTLMQQLAKVKCSIQKRESALKSNEADQKRVIKYDGIKPQPRKEKPHSRLEKHEALIISAIKELTLIQSILLRIEVAVKQDDNESRSQLLLAEKMSFGFLGQTYKELMKHQEILLKNGLLLNQSVFATDIFRTIKIRHKQICHDMFSADNSAIIKAIKQNLVPWIMELQHMAVLFKNKGKGDETRTQDLPESHRITFDPETLPYDDKQLYFIYIEIRALNRLMRSEEALDKYDSLTIPESIHPQLTAELHWEASFSYRNLDKFNECNQKLLKAETAAKNLGDRKTRHKMLLQYRKDRAIAYTQLNQNDVAIKCLKSIINFKSSSDKEKTLARIELAALQFCKESMNYTYLHEIESIFQQKFSLLKTDAVYALQLVTYLLNLYTTCCDYIAVGHTIRLLSRLNKQLYELIPTQGQQVQYHQLIQEAVIAGHEIYLAVLQAKNNAELEPILAKLVQTRKARQSFPYLQAMAEDSAAILEAAILLKRTGYESIVSVPECTGIEDELTSAKKKLKAFCSMILNSITPDYHNTARHKMPLKYASYFNEYHLNTAFISKNYARAAYIAYRSGQLDQAQKLMRQSILSKGLTHYLHHKFKQQWDSTCQAYAYECRNSRKPDELIRIEMACVATLNSKTWGDFFKTDFEELRRFSRDLHENRGSVHAQSPVSDYLNENKADDFFELDKEADLPLPPQTRLSESQQLGWNCFDVAIDLERRMNITELDPEDRAISARLTLAKRALARSGDVDYRRLLAPEIKHAAAIRSLPASLLTPEMRQLVERYLEADENILPTLIDCNDELGRKEGNRMNLSELDNFFKESANKLAHSSVFERYNQGKEDHLSPHVNALQAYCEREDVYCDYIQNYYASIDKQGRMQWFAFQRNCRGESSTSMIDITARLLQKRIAIHLPDGSHQSTDNAATETLHVNYNGSNHFAKRPMGSVTSISSMRQGGSKTKELAAAASLTP
jgi:hypothetical protein